MSERGNVDTHHKQTVSIDLAQRNTGGQVVVVVFEGKEEGKIQDSKGGASQTSFNRNTNKLGQERGGSTETSLRLVQVVDHTTGEDHITKSGSTKPNLKHKV